MATKKPTAAAQLKAAKNEIERLTKDLDAANKAKSNAEYWDKHYREKSKVLEEEVGQLHGLLDAFDGALARSVPNTVVGYGTIEYSAMTRLASWLANKK